MKGYTTIGKIAANKGVSPQAVHYRINKLKCSFWIDGKLFIPKECANKLKFRNKNK